MTVCSVKGCLNHQERGFRLHTIPKVPHRRKVWEEILRKVNQTPLDANGQPWSAPLHSKICEAHFEEEALQPLRMDGKKRKLKPMAIPTLFGDRARKAVPTIFVDRARQAKPIRFRPILPVPSPVPELVPPNTAAQDHACTASATPHPMPQPMPHSMPVVFPGSVSKNSNLNANEQLHADDSDTEDDEDDMAITNSLTDSTSDKLTKMRERMKKYRATIHQLRREKRILVKKKSILESNMVKMFGKDQIEALSHQDRGIRGIRWSKETINKARRLWQMCGSNGYEFLLQQHYPLPCIRALQRAQEEQRASPELDEVVGTSRATLLPQEMFQTGFHN